MSAIVMRMSAENGAPYEMAMTAIASTPLTSRASDCAEVHMKSPYADRHNVDMHPTRRERHARAAAALAACSDVELSALLGDAGSGTTGVGGSSTVLEVDGVAVFVKRIPLTDRERAHPGSTADLFGLPLTCQYGLHPLPGPSFGAWRELAANRLVTAGVLAGRTEAFALLHHARVLPGRPPIAAEHRDVDAVVAQFGGDPAVRTRFEELAAATSSLVLFLEHLPDALPRWLQHPRDRAGTLEWQLGEITDFLRRQGLLHMDGHFGNLRADDEQIYLIDLGLAIADSFELSAAERDFVDRHRGHDADYASMRLVNWLVTTVCQVPPPTHGGPTERNALVRRCADGDIPADAPPAIARILARHAPAAAAMNDLHWRIVAGETDAQYRGSAG